jgi:ketosteroid isomerase-like protein
MYLDKQAITLSPRPVNDYEVHEKDKPSAAKLGWYPVWARLAASGDFGVDTGPWTYQALGKDGKPETAYGDWFTVWARDKDGQWKVLFDAGIDHAAPVEPVKALDHHADVPRLKSQEGPLPATAELQDGLARAEEVCSDDAMDHGLSAAYQEMGAEDLRLLQEDHEPVVGRSAVTKVVASQSGSLVWIPMGGSVAHSGDLGYLYGMTYAEADRDKRQKPLGSFMHVWQCGTDGWKLLIAVDTPFPPER